MRKLLEARLVEEVGGLAANGSCDGLAIGSLRLDIRHQQNSVLLCVDYVLIIVSCGIINYNVLCNGVSN